MAEKELMPVGRRNKIIMAVMNGKPSDGVCETEEELKLYMRTKMEKESSAKSGFVLDVVNDYD